MFPSSDRSESFGVSLLEAAYFSKPMISTELGTGTSFVNIHLETGLVISPRNVNELRDALNILSGDNLICKKYGRNARKRFEEKFNSELTGQKYLETYKELYDSYRR